MGIGLILVLLLLISKQALLKRKKYTKLWNHRNLWNFPTFFASLTATAQFYRMQNSINSSLVDRF